MLHTTHPKKIDSLQVFRGLAALSVAAHHTATSVSTFVDGIPGWLHSIFSYGFLGVDFFFVLSGFIILNSHLDDEKTTAALKMYGSKRFARIFPPYWVVSITLLISYFLLPGWSKGGRENISLLSSLLLLPDSGPPALDVAWTLIHEVMFYLIFCVFFVSNRVFVGFVSAWAFAIALSQWTLSGTNLSPFVQKFLEPLNLEFVMGMGVAYLARRITKDAAVALLTAGIVAFALLAIWPFSVACRMLYGIPFAALVLGAVLLEAKKRPALPRWSILLGDASYSIYLVHNPLISLISRAVARMGSFANWGTGIAICMGMSVLFGVLYHVLVEKPLTKLFRQFFRRPPAPAGCNSAGPTATGLASKRGSGR